MSTSQLPAAAAVATPPFRQCGRCRALFDPDPTLPEGVLPEWWACPPCRTALLGDAAPAGARQAPAVGAP